MQSYGSAPAHNTTMDRHPEVIYLTGPTASGKTGRAVALARAVGGEIVSADSRQVFRGMDLGTGKDLEEYGDIPYHLIDVVDAGQPYNLYAYLRDARAALDDIARRGKTAVVCGGTGMYIEALLKGTVLPEVPRNDALRQQLAGKSLEELTEILAGFKALHNSTDTDTPARAIRAIEIQSYYQEHPETSAAVTPSAPVSPVWVVDIPREDRRRRITERLDSRLEAGMLDEVRRLLDAGVPPETLIGYGLEYRFMTLHLMGETDYRTMRDGLETAIHQFAKRQMTWFRGMERRGCTLRWLPWNMPTQEFTDAILQSCNG